MEGGQQMQTVKWDPTVAKTRNITEEKGVISREMYYTSLNIPSSVLSQKGRLPQSKM